MHRTEAPNVHRFDRASTRRRPLPSPCRNLHEWVTTVDHKRLGLLYIVYALIFLVLGGIEATIMRIQLIRPHNEFVSPQVFNRMFTMHGTTMIFFVAMPMVFGFAQLSVPLMIGARDMAFPRLNAFSFWMTAFGGLLLYFSFFGGDGLYGAGSAPDVGWFAYAPLTRKHSRSGHSTDFWTLALLSSGIGSIGTAINIIATILCMRCPGMTLGKMPLLVMAEPGDGRPGDSRREPAFRRADHADGRPLPGRAFLRYPGRRLGGDLDAFLLDLRPSGSLHPGASRVRVSCPKSFRYFRAKPIFGYPVMVAATVCIGFISMSVWAHHMFTVGMSSGANTFFVLSTMAIAVPTGIKIFNWLGTMWGGKIHFQRRCCSASPFCSSSSSPG